MGINAFARGMRSVNPKAEVKVDLGQLVVRPGQGARGGEHADLAERRRADAPHRLDRRRAGRRGEEGLRDRLPLRHVEVRPERAAHRGHAPLGRLLHEGRAVGRRRQVAAGQRVGRHQGRHDQARAVQQGRAAGRAGPGQEGRGRDRRRASCNPFTGPDEGQRRARSGWRRARRSRTATCPRWTTTSRAWSGSCRRPSNCGHALPVTATP